MINYFLITPESRKEMWNDLTAPSVLHSLVSQAGWDGICDTFSSGTQCLFFIRRLSSCLTQAPCFVPALFFSGTCKSLWAGHAAKGQGARRAKLRSAERLKLSLCPNSTLALRTRQSLALWKHTTITGILSMWCLESVQMQTPHMFF